MEPTKEERLEAERQIDSTIRSLREAIFARMQRCHGTIPEYLFAKNPGFAALRHPNGKWYGVVMDLPRKKLGLSGEGMVDALNVKCDPILAGSLRLQPGILPGYHMNKERWITVLLDGTVDLEQIVLLLDISYDLVGTRKKQKQAKSLGKEPEEHGVSK